MKNKNHSLFYLQTAMYNCVNIIIGGSVFQTFMLENGISEAKVSLYVSVLQILQTALMLILSKAVENIKNVLKGIAICLWSFLIMLFTMLFICINNGISPNSKYIIIYISSIIFYIFYSVYTILSYKQPHHIMDIRDYGRVTGQAGVYVGVLGTAVTAVITFALGKYKYFTTMTVVVLLGVVFSVVAGLISFVYERKDVKDISKQLDKINIFKYKPFYQLLIPNFMRGVSQGVINLVVVIGYFCKILDSASATLLVTLSQIATLVSCQSYVYFAKKGKNGILALISSIALVVTMPVMVFGGTKAVFAVFYFIAFFFNTYICYSVPTIVAENIDYNCLGQYTAWRNALFTLGIAVGGAMVPFLLSFVGGIGTLIVGGIAMLPCGIGYYIFENSQKKMKKEGN